MSVLSASYRELPRLSGPSFLPVSFFARLPTTMAPVSILTYTAASTGSLTAAGLATTATAVGTAVGAPLMGVLADRRGQRPVLVVAVLINAVALLALATGPAWPLLLTLCGLVGLSMPQIGGMARARWITLTRGRVATAFAFEGTNDEVSYVVGPALAGVLAASFGAPTALVAAAVASLVAAGAFALHHTHIFGRRELTPGAPITSRAGRSELLRAVAVPVLAMVLMGAFFASVQSAVTAFAVSIGRPSTGGLIYAVMAVGSAATALASAALPERIGPRARCLAAATLLSAGVTLMSGVVLAALPLEVAWLCGAVLVTGLGVGPLLVTLNQVVGTAAPAGRGATALALLSAGVVVGIAIGALSAGTLADAHGPLGAFAVALTAAVAQAALSLRLPRH